MKLKIYGKPSTTLLNDPQYPTDPANKNYVDNLVNSHSSNTALHLTASQNEFLDNLTITYTEANHLSGVTSNIQTQLNNRVALSGSVMTGPLTLSGAPTNDLHAATKGYVDQQDALKVNKAGDTMTGNLTLAGNPTDALHATTKQYVDNLVNNHVNDEGKHLTAGQNAFLDAITVNATEVNHLSGVSSNIQQQINAKLDKTGGLVTGDIIMDSGKTIFVSKVATNDTEVVNKAYVDARVNGLKWEDPVTDINLVADNLNTPPTSPVVRDVYIIGPNPTGAWSGKAGYAVYYNGSEWVFLQGRAVAVGDRFGVSLTSSTVPSGGLSNRKGKLVTITNATPGAISYTEDTIGPSSTTLVFDPQSSVFGFSYTLTDEGDWVPTNTSINIVAGDALELNGNILNVKYGNGLLVDNDILKIKLDTSSGVEITSTGAIAIKRDGSTISASANGIKVNDSIIADIDNRVSKTGVSTVSGSVTFTDTASLRINFTPNDNKDVVNKGYVDAVDQALNNSVNSLNTRVNSLESTVNTLNADPTTKTYVDQQLQLKINKAGDTMTGFLTLHANPQQDMHPATKQYVDSIINQQLQLKINKAGDTMTGFLTLHADPQQNMHAVTKQYVDSIAQGLSTKPAVRLATTSNLDATYNNGSSGVNATLVGNVNGALIVDGKEVMVNDRILVKDQINKAHNGDYVVQQVGNANTPFILKRASTSNESSEIPGSYFYVFDGNTLKGTGWTFVVTNPTTFTIGVDDIYVNQFSGQGSIVAGNGLTLNGNTINVNTADATRIVVNADNIDLATTGVVPNSYTRVTVDSYGRITAGSNPTTIADLGIQDVYTKAEVNAMLAEIERRYNELFTYIMSRI